MGPKIRADPRARAPAESKAGPRPAAVVILVRLRAGVRAARKSGPGNLSLRRRPGLNIRLMATRAAPAGARTYGTQTGVHLCDGASPGRSRQGQASIRRQSLDCPSAYGEAIRPGPDFVPCLNSKMAYKEKMKGVPLFHMIFA